MKNTPSEFDEYLRQGAPQKRECAESWGVAIGLQAVLHAKVSYKELR